MLGEAFSAVHDLGRLNDIAAVLIRYGFGDQVRRLGLAGVLERAGRALRWREPEALAHLEPPARARRALEELGPTFVKLGQILATRVDLFPPEWIAEFGRLQDDTPPAAPDALRAQLIADLGAPPETVFAAFDPEPLAAASLAQVHRACLADGTEVVLKIRRPGIRTVVEADLRLLARLADLVESEAASFRRYRPREIVHQFAMSLRRELDFAAECRHAERIAKAFAGRPEYVIPRVHWQWVGERLNVQDRITGIAGRDLAAVDATGLDRGLLARRGAQAVLKMMLEDGFFHADPHPGNVFYLPGNRIAFVDFGMVGRLSEARRQQVVALVHGLVQRDATAVVDVLNAWSDGAGLSSDAQIDRLTQEIDGFIDHYHGVRLRQLDLGALFAEFFTILRDHDLALPPDLSLLTKAFITLEGMGRQLDPDFDVVATAAPFLQRAALASYAPHRLLRQGSRALGDLAALAGGLPQDLRRLLRAARRGKLHLEIDVPPLQQFGRQIDRAASRLALAIVTAALIVGTAIVLDSGSGSIVPWLPPLGLLGFIAAVAGGIWLLVSILRSGGKP